MNAQLELDFQASHLRITNVYFAKYAAISRILDAQPEILDVFHADLLRSDRERAERFQRDPRHERFEYPSDTVMRVLVCQVIEGLSLREVVVRIDDSTFLRRFVRIETGPMIDFSHLCALKNVVQPRTWEKMNRSLARAALEQGQIDGAALRLDTTAVETNIHWPTDSSLLWDAYRVLERLIGQAREVDAAAVGERRAQLRVVKRLHLKITRRAAKDRPADALQSLYSELLEHVERIVEWSGDTAVALVAGLESLRYSGLDHARAELLVEQIAHYRELAERVIDQARRRVLEGQSVPNEEKLFSLFEPHTELLKRGKAGKEIEFGHMIQIQQVAQKFITHYAVFPHRPAEPGLLEHALAQHRELFGYLPAQLAADKGYYQAEIVASLRKRMETVSIAKKGKRTAQETEREHDPLFRHAQAFRAGVEGSISFLKRVLCLAR
jgi:IS5 family transposase